VRTITGPPDSVRDCGGWWTVFPGRLCWERVEVLHRGQWGTVCYENWNMRNSAVVCRELGCGEAVVTLSKPHFGPGSGPIWMDNVDCSGSESTLKNCRSRGWGKHGCNHSKDVGVICLAIRLHGDSRCSGRVEVSEGKGWATVSGADFNQHDAEVACRELGCGLPVEVKGAAHDSAVELKCAGMNCTFIFLRQWKKPAFILCVICTSLSLLYRQCEESGWLVVLTALGEWRFFTERPEVLGAAAFGRGDGQVWPEELQCRGHESEIFLCPRSSSLKHNCSHDSNVALVCAGDKPRLVGGPHMCSGRVEVPHLNSWATVCDADFDQQDAEVVCRELGCGLHVEVLGGAAFGRGEGRVWSEELQCRGHELHVYLCPKSPSMKHNCSHSNDVGVTCSG
ncbi:hypothetical protein NFI96_015818, partial [Prochilodus magdalenae]